MNTRASALRLCWLGAVLALSACVQSPQAPSGLAVSPGAAACRVASLTNPLLQAPGLGGTGAPVVRGPDPGGIGGTGQVAEGSGLGGTGSPAALAATGNGLGGTGIVGVVTGFASICVNGVEVEYGPATPVQRDGETTPLSELAVGQLVALQAVGEGDQLRAQRIAVLDAAVGPLTAIGVAAGRFEVMGQSAVALEPGDLQGLAVGDWVRVSGQRLVDGEIRATRVQRAAAGRAWVTGPYVATGAASGRVGATPVTLSGATLPAGGTEGPEISVRGEWVAGRLRAREVMAQPTRAAVGGMREVVLQGYVHSVRGREVQLGYDTVTLGESLKVEGGRLDSLRVNQAVQVRGKVDAQQRVTADRLEFRNEGRRGDAGRRVAPTKAEDTKTSTPTSASDDSPSGSSSSGGASSGGSSESGRGRGRGRGGSDGGGDGGSSGSGGSNSGSGGDSSGRGRGGDSGSSGSGSSGSGSSGSGSGGSSGSGSSGGSSSGSSGGGDSDSGRGRGRGRGGKD